VKGRFESRENEELAPRVQLRGSVVMMSREREGQNSRKFVNNLKRNFVFFIIKVQKEISLNFHWYQ